METNNRKKRICAALAAVLLGTAAVPAFAQSPEFARTEQEWALLRDNTLEWQEIDALIEEYNATVNANKASYSDDELRAKNVRETTDALLRMANEYDALAADAESTAGGALTAASYRIMANQLRSGADENVSDYRIILLGYERAKMQIIQNARELFAGYYKAAASKEQNAAQVAYLQQAYRSAKNRQENGIGTEIETLKALEELQKAQAEAITKDSEINTCYRKLITLCGWQYDDAPGIGSLPAEADGILIPEDRAAEQQKAVENSLTLKEDAIRLENAKELYGDAVVKKWTDQLAADTNTVRSAFNTAYSALRLAKDSYEAAKAQEAVQKSSLERAEKQLKLGSISKTEFSQAENTLNQAAAARENAWIELVLKKAAYDAVCQGLS